MVRLSSSIIMSECNVTNICNFVFGVCDIIRVDNIIVF